jgi:hypothetical protein
MNIPRFLYSITFVALLCSTGCVTRPVDPFELFSSHTNPVAGWKDLSFSKNSKPSPAIEKDCHDFRSKLWGFVSFQDYSEDGTGQHAIRIQVGRDGTYWTYVLIYDRNDKRIKTKKYISGHYAC